MGVDFGHFRETKGGGGEQNLSNYLKQSQSSLTS